LVVLALTPRADAWWDTGHSYIAENSVQHLPARLAAFIDQNFETIDFHASTEPPGQHYIDIDVYPEFHAGEMPRDLNELYATYGPSYVNSNGIAPWVIANYRATLTAQMSAAENSTDFEQVARTAGEMAHYIQDINQPLHTTENHNGQHTGNLGIHARYEGEMINRHIEELPISAQNAMYVADTVDWVLDSIETRTWAYVDDIMAADTLARTFNPVGSNAYYNSLWESTGEFTQSQFQFATEMVAAAWYSAWIDAGSPALGVRGDYNGDEIVDAADYVAWRKTDNFPDRYEIWRETFGESAVQSGAGSAAAPEPSSFCLLAVAGALMVGLGRTERFGRARRGSTFRFLVRGEQYLARSVEYLPGGANHADW
jgi:hypothetical protein